MLHLVTILDGQAYVVEASSLAGVAPLVHLQPATRLDHLASFRFCGRIAAAIDLSRLLVGRPFEPRLSTRILMIRRSDEADDLVGLIAEHVTDTVRIEPGAFRAVGRRGEPAFLGPAAAVGTSWARRIEIGPLIETAALAPAA